MMSLTIDPKAHAEAIDWAIWLRDPASADWAGFTDWLEASAINAAAYDHVTLVDADMAEAVQHMPIPASAAVINDFANDNEPSVVRRFGGIMAALLIAVAAYPAYQALTPTYQIETALGEQRSVTLDDGTVVDLNGGTRVTLNKRDARLATLDYGEAKFSVVHDGSAPFRVKTGGALIEDVGTVFNVTRDAGQTIVAVADGSIIYNPKQQAILVTRGRVLRAHDGSKAVEVSSVNPRLIGGWTSGNLAYEDAPITRVAADLSRALGKPVSVASSLATRHFTGAIIIDRKDAGAMRRIAALLGVNATPNAKGWQLTAL